MCFNGYRQPDLFYLIWNYLFIDLHICMQAVFYLHIQLAAFSVYTLVCVLMYLPLHRQRCAQGQLQRLSSLWSMAQMAASSALGKATWVGKQLYFSI